MSGPSSYPFMPHSCPCRRPKPCRGSPERQRHTLPTVAFVALKTFRDVAEGKAQAKEVRRNGGVWCGDQVVI